LKARAVNAEPLSVPSVSVPGEMPRGALDQRDRFLGAATPADQPSGDPASSHSSLTRGLCLSDAL
jgi:hypothetical protein